MLVELLHLVRKNLEVVDLNFQPCWSEERMLGVAGPSFSKYVTFNTFQFPPRQGGLPKTLPLFKTISNVSLVNVHCT